MQIIVEHLLSTSKNRQLYEALWNLGVKGSKSNSFMNCENQSVVTICNDLIQELRRDDPNRSNFLFSTQICFGTIILYRHQIDKLYNQARNALHSCNTTFFEINWLDQIAEHQLLIKSQTITGKGKTKGKKNDPKQHKQKENIPLNDLDLLEEIFKIPDVPEALTKTNKKGKAKQDDVDPTMALNSVQISINDAPHMTAQRTLMTHRFEDDDFGASFGENGKVFDFSSFEAHQQQEAPVDESPDLLRDSDNNQHQSAVNLPEISLTDDIKNIVTKQKKSLKRRRSHENDISLRIGPATFDDCEPPLMLDVNNNEPPLMPDANNNEPNVSQIEDVDKISEVTQHDCALAQVYSSTPNNLATKSNNKFEFPSPVSPIRPTRQPKLKKQKLIVDKVKKLNEETWSSFTKNYKKNCTVESPLTAFSKAMYQVKIMNNNFLVTPSSVFKHASPLLIPIFQRNLMKVSLKSLKRAREETAPTTESPAKKRALNEKLRTSQRKADAVPASSEVIALEEPMVVPCIEEIVPEVELQLEHFEVPEIEPELEPAELPELVEPAHENFFGKSKKADRTVYKEAEKWSKDKIMKRLNTLWKQKDDSVTMSKLCHKTNRFVAAGVFFELMVLSKLGAVELLQGKDLQLQNIAPGLKAYK